MHAWFPNIQVICVMLPLYTERIIKEDSLWRLSCWNDSYAECIMNYHVERATYLIPRPVTRASLSLFLSFFPAWHTHTRTHNTYIIYYILTILIETSFNTLSYTCHIPDSLSTTLARRHYFILSCLPTMLQQTDVPINPKRETRSLTQEVADTLETAFLCTPMHNPQPPMQLLQQREFIH